MSIFLFSFCLPVGYLNDESSKREDSGCPVPPRNRGNRRQHHLLILFQEKALGRLVPLQSSAFMTVVILLSHIWRKMLRCWASIERDNCVSFLAFLPSVWALCAKNEIKLREHQVFAVVVLFGRSHSIPRYLIPGIQQRLVLGAPERENNGVQLPRSSKIHCIIWKP